MLYFEGVLSADATSHLFSPEFIEKILNGQSGLHIKILKGFHKPGSPPLCSARINDNERALFTWKMHEGKKQILLLDRLFHKEYDAKLKNKDLLKIYLQSKNISLNLVQVDQFDSQFIEFIDQNESDNILDLLKDELSKVKTVRPLPACWMPNSFDFNILDDKQEAIRSNENNLIIGPPGSGKTLVLTKICKEICLQMATMEYETETKVASEDVLQCLYLTPHPKLAKHLRSTLQMELSQNSYVGVLDYEAFARKIDPLLSSLDKAMKRDVEDFVQWCEQNQIEMVTTPDKPTHKYKQDLKDYYEQLYQEFRMMTSFRNKYDYMNSNYNHSIFKKHSAERLAAFALYVRYCHENLIGSYIPVDLDANAGIGATLRSVAIGNTPGYDLNFYDLSSAIQQYPKLHTILIDEVQNFPLCTLLPFLNNRFRIHAAGDSDQGWLDPRSNLERIRQSFRENAVNFSEHIFTQSYRTSKKVSAALTNLLTLQNVFCKHIGQDIKTAAREIQVSPDQKIGATYYFDLSDKAKIAEYKVLCEESAKYVVIISDPTTEEAEEERFGTKLVFNTKEVSGGEFEHVILIDPFKKIAKALRKFSKQDIQDATKTNRLKDKEDMTGQELIPLFRELFVLLSRPRKSYIIFYNSHHENEAYIVQQLQKVLGTSLEFNTEIKEKAERTTESLLTLEHTPVLHLPIEINLEKIKLKQAKNRLHWIKRCNALIEQAFEESKEIRKHVYLKKAKSIFEDKRLNKEEIQLPGDCTLPEKFSCFLPSKENIRIRKTDVPYKFKTLVKNHETKIASETMSTDEIKKRVDSIKKNRLYVPIFFKNFNEKSCKSFLTKDDETVQECLFDISLENSKNLWDAIFESHDKTIIFLDSIHQAGYDYTFKITVMAAEYYIRNKLNTYFYGMLDRLADGYKSYLIVIQLYKLANIEIQYKHTFLQTPGHYMAAFYVLGSYLISQNDENGIIHLKEASGMGHAPSQYFLAELYYFGGHGVNLNREQAMQLLKQSAAAGYPDAQFLLGFCHQEMNDLDPAIQYYRFAEAQGHDMATMHLGLCYFYGRGLDKNPAEGFRLLTKASQSNSPDILYELARCYLSDKSNPETGATLLLNLAKQGHIKSQKAISDCYLGGVGIDNNEQESQKWLDITNNQNNAYLDVDLFLYQFNEPNIVTFLNQNIPIIYQCLFTAPSQNGKNLWENIVDCKEKTSLFLNTIENSCIDMGGDSLYFKKIVVAIGQYYLLHPQKPIQYFHVHLEEKLKTSRILNALFSMAGLNDPFIQIKGSPSLLPTCRGSLLFTLGNWYIKGYDPNHSKQDGVNLWIQACDLGHPEAQYFLGLGYLYGFNGQTIDEQNAIKLIKKSAEKGYARAQVKMSEFYGGGLFGIEMNKKEGEKWFQLSKIQSKTPISDVKVAKDCSLSHNKPALNYLSQAALSKDKVEKEKITGKKLN